MRQRVDCGYQENNNHTGRVMTTTNIGPCNCCGNACGCSNCLWRWIYDESTMAYKWSIIDGCGGGDGSSEPCCGCPTPPRMGEYEDEEYQIACVGAVDKCECTTCTGWWDAFLVEWVPNTGCKNTLTNIFYPACVCDLSVLTEVGTVHGEISRNVACTCSP